MNISEQTVVELSPSTRPKLTNLTCRVDLGPYTPRSNESGVVLTIESIGLSSKIAGACVDNSINIYDGSERLSKFCIDLSTINQSKAAFYLYMYTCIYVKVKILIRLR